MAGDGATVAIAKDAMARKKLSPQDIKARLDEYATWVSELRSGHPVEALPVAGADPLARLALELDQLAETLSQREHELRRLFDLIETVEQGVLIDDVLNRVFDAFTGVIPFDRIGCAFLSEDGKRLAAYWARTNLGPPQITRGYTQKIAGSSLEPILKTGAPRILNDLERYLDEKPNSDSTRRIVEEGGRSSFTCPLMINGKPIGVLFFTSREKNTYEKIHQTIFRQIASQLAVIIGKSQQYEQILKRNRELARQSRKLEEIASTDALTRVLNRGAILEVLRAKLAEAKQTGQCVGVIMADIDHFKRVNDTLGHPAGDQALKIFTKRLAAALRSGDRLGRYGGEEFLIILADITEETLATTAERLRRCVADEPFELNLETRPITASFGAATCGGRGKSPEDVIADADRALYAAKSGGRNKVVSAADIPEPENRAKAAGV